MRYLPITGESSVNHRFIPRRIPELRTLETAPGTRPAEKSP